LSRAVWFFNSLKNAQKRAATNLIPPCRLSMWNAEYHPLNIVTVYSTSWCTQGGRVRPVRDIEPNPTNVHIIISRLKLEHPPPRDRIRLSPNPRIENSPYFVRPLGSSHRCCGFQSRSQPAFILLSQDFLPTARKPPDAAYDQHNYDHERSEGKTPDRTLRKPHNHSHSKYSH